MDKREFSLFSMALRAYYPKENLLPSKESMQLWHKQLEDIPYKVAEAGLNKWVATNKWSPSIADIREMAISVTQKGLPQWGEAWQEVCTAIRRYGSYRVGEALNSLSPLARQATQQIGFMNLCMSENPATDRANFRMIYERLAEREKMNKQLPKPLQELIETMQGKLLE